MDLIGNIPNANAPIPNLIGMNRGDVMAGVVPEPAGMNQFNIQVAQLHDENSYGTHTAQTENLNLVYESMQDYFPTITAQAAILGNINKEAPSFDFSQKERGVDVGGVGLFQFTNQHRDRYNKFIKERGIDNSIDSQLKYVYDSIYGGGFNTEQMGYGNAEKIRNAFKGDDPVAASDMLLDRFFKPLDPEASRDDRRSFSQNYYDQLSNL